LCSCEPLKPEQSASRDTPKTAAPTQVEVTKVISQILDREVKLPADLLAFRDVLIYPKVPGFVEWIGVDRGSTVKAGQLLIRMTAPELPVQTMQNTSQALAARDDSHQLDMDLGVVRDQLLAAQAKAKASADTFERLKSASASYAGVVAGNDLEIAQKTAEADAASVSSLKNKVESLKAQGRAFKNRQQAAQQATSFTKDLQSYLLIRAAFDGKITERNVHEGSFVHPPSTDTTSIPLLRLQQLSLLRLVVPVPETDIGGIVAGASVKFTVAAFPGEGFGGTVRRIASSVDLSTRTMAVELDVENKEERLTPGMFAEAIWPVRRRQASLFVPRTAIVKTTERTFVVRIHQGKVEWVDVKPGMSADNLVEVFGDLHDGDQIAIRGTDELRSGAPVSVKEAPAS